MPDAHYRTHDVVALMAGRYELVRELDARGDVRRWEAFDTALQRRVLLEFLPHDIASDPDVVERFWRSARSSARHSTTVGERVMDAGTDRETGRAFVVREWFVASDETVALPVPKAPPRVATTECSRIGRSKLALIALGLAAAAAMIVVRPALQGWMAWVNEPFGQATQRFVLGPPPQLTVVPTSAPTVVSTTTAAARPTVAATATPRATQTPAPTAGVARRIVNTDGRGVALRASPGGDRLPGKGYDEGATVQAFESSGEWTRIQGSDGRQGWVLSVTLSR